MTRALILRSLLMVGVLGAALGPAPAEARFGKKSSPQKVKEQKKKEQKEKAAERHAATPVNAGRHSAPPPAYVSGSACCYESYDTVYVEPAPVYVSSGYTYYSAPAEVYQPAPDPDAYRVHHFEAMGSAQPMLNGAVLGLGLRVDWKRWGIDARYDNVSLLAEDGSLSFDTIRLLDTAVTYSLLEGEKGRLRVHAGLYSAFAPDIIFVGPGAGASVSLNVLGPFTAETGANLVLIPFTKLDAHAALGFRLGFLEARGGVRFTALDDQGRVDGVRNTDVLMGPYVSLGLVL